ncbi:MAG: P27 family phage terminase small subunit [Planctomycetota bacterium]|nr:P27 family phage terminase small subunit [Planctomycetota bacterium]
MIPEHLTEAQANIWREVVARVGEPATPSAAQHVEAYCVERARWLDAEAFIAANGTVLTLRNDKGEVTKILEAPQLKVAQRSRAEALKLASRIGLNRHA